MAVRQLDLAVASATVFCTGVVEVIEEGTEEPEMHQAPIV